QTFGNRQQSAEVVMNHDHDATKSTFNQSPLDQLPILEIFTAWSCHAGEDLFFAVAAQADDDVNTSGAQFIAIATLDIFTVKKQRQHIGMNRAAVPQIELFDEANGDTFQILLGTGQAHLLKGI